MTHRSARSQVVRVFTAFSLLSGVLGCSDALLEDVIIPPPPPLDNRMAVAGDFCTDDPSELRFPVRILFAVDTSQSMNVTDPPGTPTMPAVPERINAIVDVINTYINEPGIEFMIMSFNVSPNVLTQCDDPDPANMVGMCLGRMDCFTSDRCELIGCPPANPSCTPCPGLCATGNPPTPAIADLLNTGGTTEYTGMLSRIQQVLFSEMTNMDEVDNLRARYIVIIITDGLPDTDDPDNTAAPCLDPAIPQCNIYDAVDDIVNLDQRFEVGEISVHTVYLSGNTPDWAQVEPQELLRTMAEDYGDGTFRDFGNGETINFLDIDFTSLRRRFAIKTMTVTNSSVRSSAGWLYVDSDSDGLVDERENLFGTSEVVHDTDGDGFSDFLEFVLRLSGADALNPMDAQCFAGVDDYDGDGDGLLDCEERFLGTSPALNDSDADGVLDLLEVLNGTDPATDDAFDDLEFDGMRNWDEIRVHLDPTTVDVANVSDMAYRYYLSETGIVDSTTCYDFRVENIRLLTTEDAGIDSPNRGWNKIMVYVNQVPFDDPRDYGNFKIGCVLARFVDDQDLMDPPDGIMTLTGADLKLPVGRRCLDDTECDAATGHVCDLTLGRCIGPTVFDPSRDCVMP